VSTEYASVEDLTADEVTTVDRGLRAAERQEGPVRGMSRWELQQIGKGTDDPSVAEARMLTYCMIQPRMSEAQVTAMQKGKAPGFLGPFMGRIRTLSGLDEGAAKSDVA
jgi:hypothetical protein